MKKLTGLFSVFVLSFFLFSPINAFAEKNESLPQLEVDKSSLNGNEAFSVVENSENSNEVVSMAASGMNVTLRNSYGTLEGNWVFSSSSPITYSNIVFSLQYKKIGTV
ncbi:MAG: hypothetical protein ACQEUT_12350 [Bacillota bacterium]